MDTDKNTIKRARILKGTVVSNKMMKTVVVAVVRLVKHPKYKKFYKITNRFKAHDNSGQLQLGQKVEIQEVRPLSKDKRWLVIHNTI